MNTLILQDPRELGQAAGEQAAGLIRKAIEDKGQANIILATGASQFEMLRTLVGQPNVDWTRVVMFHLDEYIGLPATHPASFRKYLKERFVDKVGRLKAANFLEPDPAAPADECARMGKIIAEHPIDVALIGIGENGHLAFNDPPADFDTDAAYIVVDLDKACRMQQVGEGWFKTLDDVPRQAISMTIKQIMRSRHIISSVPDKRKAKAVRDAIEGPITPMCPASILRNHEHCTQFLDKASASLLR